jgi:hypothetical protein
MAKKIYPGNWVAQLTGWSRTINPSGEVINGPNAVEYLPGQLAYYALAYAEIPLPSFVGDKKVLPLMMASPDAYWKETGRPPKALIIPQGATIISVGLRLEGRANLTTGHSIKVASSVAASVGAITAGAASSSLLPASVGGVLSPGTAKFSNRLNTTASTGPLQMQVYSVDATGTAAGGDLTRQDLPFADIPTVIAEVVWLADADLPTSEMLGRQPSGINQSIAFTR